MDNPETIPILAAPVGESRNPPGSPVVVCPGCQELLAIDDRSLGLVKSDARYQVWCWRCAAGRWPDMELLGTEGTWIWVEEFDGVNIGQIHVGRLPLRGWLRGATKGGEQ
jgi:hypothetical protein